MATQDSDGDGLYSTEGAYDERRRTANGHTSFMGTTESRSFQSTLYIAVHSAVWENLERQLAESPIDTEQIEEITTLLVRWRGGCAHWTVGMAEDAHAIRSDWGRVGEGLREAIARVGDELRLEGVVV